MDNLAKSDADGVEMELQRREDMGYDIIVTAEDLVKRFTLKLSDRMEALEKMRDERDESREALAKVYHYP